MKYIIERTSDLDARPTDYCIHEEVHKFDYRNLRIKEHEYNWKQFHDICRDISIVDGYYVGVRKMATDVWVSEVDDLHEFVRKYGRIILFPPDNEEGLWKIEIYDDYRE